MCLGPCSQQVHEVSGLQGLKAPPAYLDAVGAEAVPPVETQEETDTPVAEIRVTASQSENFPLKTTTYLVGSEATEPPPLISPHPRSLSAEGRTWMQR